MRVLLVYPEFPLTFWNFKYTLQFTEQKAAFPPLGLLTVASMLPKEWEKKLVDLNIEPLKDEHLKWADYVFITGMDVQQNSAIDVIRRCKELKTKIVAGGPFFTENYKDFEHVDHLVLGEAEATIQEFLKDIEKGSPKHRYMPDAWPAMEKTPPPMWELLDLKDYTTAAIQFSRGCPFDCEFCQITRLFGRKVRTKSKEQIIKELDLLYNLGWRASIFFADDNFIGNKNKLKKDILPAVTEWMEKRHYPFQFFTQASINLADDEELMRLMADAGFYAVFLGIETPDDDCLAEAGKFHNRNRDLLANVKKMQRFGLEVWSGFIIGFDSDKESIFERMPRFIQESGITIAMVGLLIPLKGTRLYERLEKEKRIIYNTTGNNTDFTINFITKMDKDNLLDGYKKILKRTYSPQPYYHRVLTFLREYNPCVVWTKNYNSFYLKDIYSTVKKLAKCIILLGILEKGRIYFWRLFFWSVFRRPTLLPRSLILWVYGYHFRKVYKV